MLFCVSQTSLEILSGSRNHLRLLPALGLEDKLRIACETLASISLPLVTDIPGWSMYHFSMCPEVQI